MRTAVITLECLEDDEAAFHRKLLDALGWFYSRATFKVRSIEFRSL